MGILCLVRLVLLLALLSGCVEETLVLGDGRARHACEEAPQLVAPAAGCTTIRVESVSPYGCLEEGVFGTSGRDHAGSWVRLSVPPGQQAALDVTLVDPSTSALATLRAYGGTPCACEAGGFTSHPFTTSIEVVLDTPEEEVLLEPLGATFDVALCAWEPTHP